MQRLRFTFNDLYPDAPELPGDLDWLLRFVASRFEVRVEEARVLDELDFPVLDLARALDAWIAADFDSRHDFEYEVPGGSALTLTIRSTQDGWVIDSVHRYADEPLPRVMSDGDVRSGVRSFVDELALETRRGYHYDVKALLERVAARSRR